MLQAKWWTKGDQGDGSVICQLCVHGCLIAAGKRGYCGVRTNTAGELATPFAGKFSAIAVDPVEKKPLYHWHPEEYIFSVGSLGCTMRCPFCQNHSIAQPQNLATAPPVQGINPEQLLAAMQERKLSLLAFTYNEPTLQAEYLLVAGTLLKDSGIEVALVTNGMMSQAALQDLLPFIDALNVDIKTFNEKHYASMGGSLQEVKRNVEALAKAGKHMELTTLVVPGISDNLEEFQREVDWIASISCDIPLHLSRYSPAHKYTAPSTTPALLNIMQEIALQKLTNVHLGNVGIRKN